MALICEAEKPVETKELIGGQSTSSTHDHLSVLRGAGLIRTVKVGSSLAHSSRATEHNDQFRAVIAAIMVAARDASLACLARQRAEALWEELATPGAGQLVRF